MGQYLSKPSTDKESEEGHADALAYGLAAMQGWRVSMEDAHIAALDLDPANQTSLFAVFDGHGGRAVSQFCAAHLSDEFLHSDAYRRGDLIGAITEAYFRLDVLLDSKAGQEELRQYVSNFKPKQPGALFTNVETKLAAEAHEDQVHAEAEEVTVPLSSGSAVDSTALANSSSSSREQLKAQDVKSMKELCSSKDFLESHLMRASVLTPMHSDEVQAPAAASSSKGDGCSRATERAAMPMNTLMSGGVALADPPPQSSGMANGSSSSVEEEVEEEEEHHASGMGATAVSVIVCNNQVIVANTGDSRCVLSKKGQARALTLDHKPILFEEAKRIIKAGGFVRDNRINGALNVSRTIGDLDFKRNTDLPHTEQMVVATPDIEQFTLEEGDEFLILACDGIWDVLTNQEAVDFVRKRLKAGERLKTICEVMCDACLAPDLKGLCRGADNMSIILVLFKKHAKLGGFWSSLLAACGKAPAYKRIASSKEMRRR